MNKIIIAIVVVAALVGGYFIFNSSNSPLTGTVNNTDTTVNVNDNTDSTPNNTSNNPGTAQPGTSTPTPSQNVKEFTVLGSNFAFAPSSMTVKKGDKVRIIFKNTGGTHDFVIDEFNVATSRIQGGAQETVEFTASKTGSFEYYCSVGTHRQMGMRGTLTVTP